MSAAQIADAFVTIFEEGLRPRAERDRAQKAPARG
jgi:hypothetical protein